MAATYFDPTQFPSSSVHDPDNRDPVKINQHLQVCTHFHSFIHSFHALLFYRSLRLARLLSCYCWTWYKCLQLRSLSQDFTSSVSLQQDLHLSSVDSAGRFAIDVILGFDVRCVHVLNGVGVCANAATHANTNRWNGSVCSSDLRCDHWTYASCDGSNVFEYSSITFSKHDWSWKTTQHII